MTTLKDYYQLLSIPRDATDEDIKKAFHELALKYHPDKNKEDDAEERFKEINEAHKELSDPNRRNIYDQNLLIQSINVPSLLIAGAAFLGVGLGLGYLFTRNNKKKEDQ